MPRISNLPALTTPDNSDELAIVDTSASVTKKITRGDLLKAPLPTNSVTTAAIASGSITAAKINTATFPKFKATRTTALTFPRNSTTIFAADTVEYNIGGGTVSGGRYTAPLTGVYNLESSFVILDNPVSGWIIIYVNGNVYSYQEYSAGFSNPTMRASTSVTVNSGDIIDVRFRNESTTRDPIIHVEPTQPKSSQLTINYVP